MINDRDTDVPPSSQTKTTTWERKLELLERATTAAETLLAEKERALSAATEALEGAKSKLKSLSPEAQESLQVNDTELPDLISSKILAQEEYDEAKKRVETNQRYLTIVREKASRGD
ncbi:hypothetical protein ACHAWF_017052 [Thalassiosira exigua]